MERLSEEDNANKLAYYHNQEGALVLVQQVESHYGGTHKTLLVTDVNSFETTAIASSSSYYDVPQSPTFYYVYPKNQKHRVTGDFINGGFSENQEPSLVSKEQYEQAIDDYMTTLTPTEEIPLTFTICYNLYNPTDSANEMRYNEIYRSSQQFQTPKLLQKTSDMVADILYDEYVSHEAPLP